MPVCAINRSEPGLDQRWPAPDSWYPGGMGAARGRGAYGWSRRLLAFTLLELLVVIGIIGILAASSVPAIRSLTQSNSIAAGNRQMLDDLAIARQSAISGRRTVYVVFVPPTMRSHFPVIARNVRDPQQRALQLRQLTNLVSGQFSSYALFTRRTVGDQPGRGTPRYLTEWKSLPEGMLVATNKFIDLEEQWLAAADTLADTNRPLPYAWFPFPSASSLPLRLPYVAFDSRGQVYYEGGLRPKYVGESVALSRGSIFYPKRDDGTFDLGRALDVVETPKGNRTEIRVNWLTGRAKVETVELR